MAVLTIEQSQLSADFRPVTERKKRFPGATKLEGRDLQRLRMKLRAKARQEIKEIYANEYNRYFRAAMKKDPWTGKTSSGPEYQRHYQAKRNACVQRIITNHPFEYNAVFATHLFNNGIRP